MVRKFCIRDFIVSQNTNLFLFNPRILGLIGLKLLGLGYFFHLFEGPEFRTHYREDREEKRAQRPAGFKPPTFLLRGVCFTSLLQTLPCLNTNLVIVVASKKASHEIFKNLTFSPFSREL